MKKLFLAFILAALIFGCFAGCADNDKEQGTSSYVDIDQFEDDGENIIPSTPNASVTIPSDWVN